MTDNPLRKIILAGLIIAIVGFIFVFIPGIVGIEGMSGGFSISFLSFFVGIVGVVVTFFYFRLATVLDKILRGDGLLVHWKYTAEKWAEYTEREYATERTEKKGLFFVVSAFALFFGFLFWAIDNESGFFVFVVMLGLIAACGLAWQLTAWQEYRANKQFLGEAYIGRDGVYLNRRLHAWNLLWSNLTKVSLDNKRDSLLLIFEYSAFAFPVSQSYVVRVPVPEGQEEAAKIVLRQFTQERAR